MGGREHDTVSTRKNSPAVKSRNVVSLFFGGFLYPVKSISVMLFYLRKADHWIPATVV